MISVSTEEWHKIRAHFRRSFASNLHVSIATVDAGGQPNVTPIGSFFLNRDDYSGFYFEIFTRNIPVNAQTNRRVCVMAVNSRRWFWIKSLFNGKFSEPPMIKIYGEIGERRAARPEEIQRAIRRLGWMRKLPGGKKLFGNLGLVREIRFDRFEVVKLGDMV